MAASEQLPLLQSSSRPPRIPGPYPGTLPAGSSRLTKAPALAQSITSSRFAQGKRSRLERLRPSLDHRTDRWTGRLTAACTCNTLSMPKLFGYFLAQDGFVARRFSRDVVHLAHNPTSQPSGADGHDVHAVWSEGVEDSFCGHGDVFLFSYGVAIFWGFTEGSEWSVLDTLESGGFENGRLENEVCQETFDYAYSADSASADLVRVDQDVVLLASDLNPEDMVRVKLAVSHSVAQSIKLESFESAIEGMFERVGHFPVELANAGHLHVSDRDLLKLSGEIFTYKAYINLQADLLETPDWFWDNANVEPAYDKVTRYLDIRSRVTVLNERLTVLQEMNQLFRDASTTEYGHRLEWIIIILIVLEVFLQVLDLIATLTSKKVAG